MSLERELLRVKQRNKELRAALAALLSWCELKGVSRSIPVGNRPAGGETEYRCIVEARRLLKD